MRIMSILLLILAWGGHTAWAEDDGRRESFFPTEEEKDIAFLNRDSWVSTTHIAYYGPEDKDNRDIRMTVLNIGAERYVRKNLGIVADAYLASTTGHIIHSDNPAVLVSDSVGIGGSLGLKWHFLRGRHWSAFINGTAGLLFTDGKFPSGGTSWNFMGRTDLGFTYRLQNQWHLIASISRLHVSNGKGLVRENPSFNGEGGYIGLVYRFDKLGIFD